MKVESLFNDRHAEQLSCAIHGLLTEMCIIRGNGSFDELVPHNLNKRNVTKEKMCQWLGALTHMMNRFANPHLQMLCWHY